MKLDSSRSFQSAAETPDRDDDYDYEHSSFLVPCLECGQVKVLEDEIYCPACYDRLEAEGYFDA